MEFIANLKIPNSDKEVTQIVAIIKTQHKGNENIISFKR